MKHKHTMLVSTLLCLLPILLGLALYGNLPDQLPIHFDLAGNPDNYAAKPLAVFGLPLFMALINMICHRIARFDTKTVEASPAVLLSVTDWIIPVLCNILMPITLFKGMSKNVPISLIVSLIVGLTFVIIGNYLPKVKPNRYMGIKLPWTFSSEENWRRTHRLGGFTWVLAGLLTIIAGLFSLHRLLILSLAAAILVPSFYSWWLAKYRHI